MAKTNTNYVCAECGGQTSKWQGQCPHCMAWNTLTESVREAKPSRFQALAANGEVVRLSAVQALDTPRIATGLAEFDRVLGGGLVGGGVVLIGGDPGIGKSTCCCRPWRNSAPAAAPCMSAARNPPRRLPCARAVSG
jgi:DNA repair protein RadA/Sms